MDLMKQIIDDVISEKTKVVEWPDRFFNSETQRYFEPQNEEVQQLMNGEIKDRYVYLRAAEASGKSASLVNITLNKLKRGTNVAYISPTLPYAVKLWKEVRAWINWDLVVPEHRHMQSPTWQPYRSVTNIVFVAEDGRPVELVFGAYGESPIYWEGSNWQSVHGDELRAIRGEEFMKVFSGRTRITSRNGEPPQIVIASTPTDKSHWMYKYFGDIQKNDPLLDFKKQTRIIRLSVYKNLHNLASGHIEARSSTLTTKEKEIFIEGNWADLSGENSFLDNIDLWRRLYDPKLTPPKKKEDSGRDWSDALIVGADGATKNDSFAVVSVSRHPENRQKFAVRTVMEFKPNPHTGKIDHQKVEEYIRRLCKDYNVLTIVYDEHQLYSMMERLRKDGVAWVQSFSQMSMRTKSDQFLYETILQENLSHQNDEMLNDHFINAGVKYDNTGRNRRLEKKTDSLKIDLCVALGMALYECNRLNL